MPSATLRLLQNPVQAIKFTCCFFAQLLLIALHHILLPSFPQYQCLRIEVQRAYLISTSLYFPTFTHRLPADYGPNDAISISGKGWSGYVIPGPDPDVLKQAAGNGELKVVLYGHGGGYARGEARMYVPYMKRWVEVARHKGLEIVFLSVEYRRSLTLSQALSPTY
jgi:acetyl esterase/lipase